MDTIVSSNEYYNMFKKFTTVKMFDQGYSDVDFKSAVKNLLKKLIFRVQRNLYSYIKGKTTIGISHIYEGDPLR